MQIIKNTRTFKLENTAITIGKFDAFHKGHMSLIEKVVECKKEGLLAVLFTFDRSPYEYLSDNSVKYIISREEKYEICEKAGIDVVIEYPFDCETINMEPDEFVQNILVEQLSVSKIIVGKDFHFGKQRKGDVEFLKQYKTFEVIALEKKRSEAGVISSSAIREAILKADIPLANEMLGHDLKYNGNIIHGKKLGRKIGAPTINIDVEDDRLLPPFGVYATKVFIDSKWYNGITNIGLNPTVSDTQNVKVETHLIDENVDVYGEKATIYIKAFIRCEKKFDNIEQLQQQIMSDIEKVKEKLKQ